MCSPKTGDTARVNQPLKAVVRNGRLTLDEPTDLPEGKEVHVVLVDDDGDFAAPWMDTDEASAFNASMAASIADEDAGRVMDADVVLAELRAQAS